MSQLRSSLFEGIPDADSPTYSELTDYVRSKGYEVRGNKAISRGVKHEYSTPLSMFEGDMIPTFIDQTTQLIKNEYRAQQGAADRQYGRNEQATGSFQDLVSQIPGRMKTGGDTKPLEDLISQIEALGAQQQSDVMKGIGDVVGTAKSLYKSTVGGIDDVIGSLSGMAKSGSVALNTAAARAEAASRDAIAKYDQGINEDVIRSTVSGIRAEAHQAMQMIRGGTGPDGRRLTPAEQSQMMRDLRFDVGRQAVSVATQVRAQAQETLAGLRTSLAGVILEGGKMRAGASELEMQGANLAMQGENLKGQAGERLTATQQFGVGALLQSQEGQRALQGVLSGVTQFMSQLKQSTELSSLQMEMQGRGMTAEMIRANPESIISVLSAFMALGSFATAPNGTTIKGLNI